MKKQIIAIGGAALPLELDNLLLVDYFLKQTGKRKPKVCFIGTAHGDADAGRLRFYAGFGQFNCQPTHLPLFARTPRDLESFVMEQDAIFVGGGNTRSMLAICWFEQGITDSIAGSLTALDCLGFLPGSNCPHYNSEPLRRPTYRKMVARGAIAEGYAADDGVALHFIDGKLAKVVSNHKPGRGWRLIREGRTAVERPLPTRVLQPRSLTKR
jgi:peptidase E